MSFKHVPLLCLTLLFAMLCACAEKGIPTEEEMDKKAKDFQNISRSRRVNVLSNNYLGTRPVPIRGEEKGRAALQGHVLLKIHGDINAICASLGAVTPLNVQAGSGTQSKTEAVSISYEGPLEGLLEQIAQSTGFGWEYDERSKTITFSRLVVRTFTILSAPGVRQFEDNITNKSKESTSSSSSGNSNVGSTVQTADTESQTAQSNSSSLSFDVWASAENNIKNLISQEGKVVSNPVAGTITVRDRYPNIKAIERYVADMNVRLSRQVALTVHVWMLDITNKVDTGIDLSVLFSSPDVSVVAGALQTVMGAAGTASATIVKGKLKDSVGIAKALKEWGNATQVTSGGGVTLSNQPVPIQAISRTAYLASSSTSQSEYQQTTTLTPGEVTTGFAMTLIPHILERRRVILQYTINLSKLDDMVEFSSNDVTVQLPKTSNRSFSQRSTLQMGETLILAGFQHQLQDINNTVGLLNLGRNKDYTKTMLIITIETEEAGGGTED